MIPPYQAPAYVMQIKRDWRIVVPVRGKLNPKVSSAAFTTRDAAVLWLGSFDGQDFIAKARQRLMRSQAYLAA